MKTHSFVFIFLCGLLLVASCNKETPSVTPDTRELLSDIEGRYVGLVENWVVQSVQNPNDTSRSSRLDTFVLKVPINTEGVPQIEVTVPSSLGNIPLEHSLTSPDPSAGALQFRYNTRVDPVYGYSDGTQGWLVVHRPGGYANGEFSHNLGPGSYGVVYSGVKIE